MIMPPGAGPGVGLGRPSVIVPPGLGLQPGAGGPGGMGSLLVPKVPGRRVSRVSTVHNIFMTEVGLVSLSLMLLIVS